MNENLPNSVNEISQTDWEKTPESVKRLVNSLVGRIEQLEQQYEEFKVENELLKEQVKQNSQNSSQPPSQDMSKGFKVKEKPKSGKQRGGQPGHEGHGRSLYPTEQCQNVEDYYPEACVHCGGRLNGVDHDPHRIQVVEIPPIVPQVCEHRFHALACGRCGGVTRAWDEEICNGSGYGERVVAHVGVLSGQYRQSHRMVQELLWELFGVEISVGSINQLRQESSDSVAEAVVQAQRYVQAQAQVNMDETSFAQGNSDGNNPTRCKGWLWVIVTPLVSYFAVCLGRSQAVCQDLLGQAFNGIVSSDRFSAYTWLELKGRQLCWAHLKRDFTRIAERSGVSGELGRALLAQQKLLFELWYRVRDGTLERSQFILEVAPIQQRIHELLSEGSAYVIGTKEKTPLAKTVRTCQQLLKVETALWTFVTTAGIEPTNNAAERALRPAVLWRKNSFGSQSQVGSLFVSRMLTVVTTLRSQNRPVLDYLVEACRAARQGRSAPSLLPTVAITP
ncbi:IS66 family transposase (plasmid) [Kovacikia minuta CCNUW1]|uniref:IS66 family transposase n=1 Tax=Kovacikia minuta TaxID=2931930 RepID=UPI001CCC20BA|nr:IS66 family transposase [Kovacikia minuta]UBF25898.1 IS66 family transposase [Kovacikia minuta CCNUW1]UBF26526.1 IS66 family transposase [Kovacikia minuta CCNUW1]UBF26696.1 IS66 family transposase [Kovacikia minuta CCNUW1]UBF30595.1 IS66 family transposase [Kovacikia minuta CCNUW1]UBF30750.1 IS66 family transposase [Kovacikia minuta CCNUW1]